jgi:hypothetical protein
MIRLIANLWPFRFAKKAEEVSVCASSLQGNTRLTRNLDPSITRYNSHNNKNRVIASLIQAMRCNLLISPTLLQPLNPPLLPNPRRNILAFSVPLVGIGFAGFILCMSQLLDCNPDCSHSKLMEPTQQDSRWIHH